jgi:HPt (histidine-containing phosphotransfer) domain-containing protein
MENIFVCLPKNIEIDWEQLHQISENCPQFELELLTMLTMDVKEHLANLRRAIVNNDLVELALEAHYIKGASANVGVSKISELASNLEVLAKSKQLHRSLDIVREMELNLELLEAFINQQTVSNYN